MRKAGVLLAVSSLPGGHGIGDFGESGYQFVDLLKQGGFKYWQILPLNPVGYGNSPYQPYSSNAMDEIYISLDLLKKDYLLFRVEKFENSDQVDYEKVRTFKEKYLRKAFKRFKEDAEYQMFTNYYWVHNYAVYMALRRKNGCVWYQWPQDQKDWIKNHQFDLSELAEEIKFEKFVQYELYKQWRKLKAYANHNGIDIMGDLPIYVGIDSEDVYSNQQDLLLDEDGRPSFVAGVPPDYFSKTGHRWGNPIYNWEQMRKENFNFWIQSLSYTSLLFDVTRIDHFRGFDTYWKIPATCETAVEGEWVEAPGYELFDTLYASLSGIKLVAEDLGQLRDEVYQLRDHYHLPGMKIMEFTFFPFNEAHFKERENLIVYTGTHDNETLKGWIDSKDEHYQEVSKHYLDICGCTQANIYESFIYYVLNSLADTAVIPMQDILQLDNRARMNEPGTVQQQNWCWRMNDLNAFKASLAKYQKWLKETKRV